jgi:hypothetical protein
VKNLIFANVLAFLVASVAEVGPAGISVYPQAGARVGRPLTPASVAGVARRTARRCAAGVYYCQKPNKKAPAATVTAIKSKHFKKGG